MKTQEELIQGVKDLIGQVYQSKGNGLKLASLISDIAGFNWTLGEMEADLSEQEQAMKDELKHDEAQVIDNETKDGMAVNKAEIKATLLLAEKRKEYNKVNAQLKKVKTCRDSNEIVIDANRTLISSIKKDLEQA